MRVNGSVLRHIITFNIPGSTGPHIKHIKKEHENNVQTITCVSSNTISITSFYHKYKLNHLSSQYKMIIITIFIISMCVNLKSCRIKKLKYLIIIKSFEKDICININYYIIFCAIFDSIQ